jgi:hypothetical protein
MRDEEREEEEALDFGPDFEAAALEGVEWEEDMLAGRETLGEGLVGWGERVLAPGQMRNN